MSPFMLSFPHTKTHVLSSLTVIFVMRLIKALPATRGRAFTCPLPPPRKPKSSDAAALKATAVQQLHYSTLNGHLGKDNTGQDLINFSPSVRKSFDRHSKTIRPYRTIYYARHSSSRVNNIFLLCNIWDTYYVKELEDVHEPDERAEIH